MPGRSRARGTCSGRCRGCRTARGPGARSRCRGRRRPAGCGCAHGLPSQQDLAAVGRVDAGDALDQHRLAGAVVAGQRRDLAGGDVEVDVGERLDGAEVLLDAASRSSGAARVRRAPLPLRGSSRVRWPPWPARDAARSRRRRRRPGHSADAELGTLTRLVLDHGVGHVLGGDPHRRQQHRLDVGVGRRCRSSCR